MPPSKRSDFQREENYVQITELYLRGKKQSEIAALLGLSQGMISNDLKVIQRRWRETTAMNLDEAKAKELAELSQLRREYWLDWERYFAAWEASKVERTKKRQRKGATGAIDASIETEQRDGNPAFLDGMIKCKQEIVKLHERRCKLLGLDAPTKSELEVTQPIAVTIDR